MDRSLLYTHDEIESVAHMLAQEVQHAAIVTFTGPLGAGKTTMVRALLRALGITEAITSPTYTYVNVYKNNQGKTFYHFDLYRINSVDDFTQFGFNEYLYAPHSCALIEWPEVIAPLYKGNVVRVILEYTDDPEKRCMKISAGPEQKVQRT